MVDSNQKPPGGAAVPPQAAPVINATPPSGAPDNAFETRSGLLQQLRTKKTLYALGGLSLFLISLGAGLVLVKQQQDIREGAQAPDSSCQADIMLVIDRSSTMNSKEKDGRTKLAWAVDGAKTFVNTLASKSQITSRIGLTSFGGQGTDGGIRSNEYNTTLDLPLNGDTSTVLGALNNLRYKQQGTCIECGLRIGNAQLSTSRVQKYLILLSDGLANRTWGGQDKQAIEAAKAEAARGRGAGTTYFVIGYGTLQDKANEPVLKEMAGDTNRYYFTPSASDWNSIFSQIAQRICATQTQAPIQTEVPRELPTQTAATTPPEETTAPTDTPTDVPTDAPTEVPDEVVIVPTDEPAGAQAAIAAQCFNVRAYNQNWSLLAVDDLKKLKSGDIVRFAIGGSTSAGNYDKARFTINGVSFGETTNVQGGVDGFYTEYLIPEGTKQFQIDAQIHHSQLEWF